MRRLVSVLLIAVGLVNFLPAAGLGRASGGRLPARIKSFFIESKVRNLNTYI
jgi:hypothetical protein